MRQHASLCVCVDECVRVLLVIIQSLGDRRWPIRPERFSMESFTVIDLHLSIFSTHFLFPTMAPHVCAVQYRMPLMSTHLLSSGSAYCVVHVCSEGDMWRHASENGIAVSDWVFSSTWLSQSWPVCIITSHTQSLRKAWLFPLWFASVCPIAVFLQPQ